MSSREGGHKGAEEDRRRKRNTKYENYIQATPLCSATNAHPHFWASAVSPTLIMKKTVDKGAKDQQ